MEETHRMSHLRGEAKEVEVSSPCTSSSVSPSATEIGAKTKCKPYEVDRLDIVSCFFATGLCISGPIIDGYLAYTYYIDKLWWYFGITLFLVLVPTIMLNAFSMKWHEDDNKDDRVHWFFNITLFGVIHRHWITLKAGYYAWSTGKNNKKLKDRNLEERNLEDRKHFCVLARHMRDLSVLDLYKAFLKSAPQLVLQLYILFDTKDWSVLTGAHFVVSTIFAIAATRAMLKEQGGKKASFWQQIAHGIAMGAGFTFCFINMGDNAEGSISTAFVTVMYAFAFQENIESLLTYLEEMVNGGWHTYGILGVVWVGSTSLIGLICTCIYRCCYHRACEIALFPYRTPVVKDDKEKDDTINYAVGKGTEEDKQQLIARFSDSMETTCVGI